MNESCLDLEHDKNDSLFSRPITIIKAQATAAFLGLMFYPVLSRVYYRPVIYYTPVCVCTHLMSMLGALHYIASEVSINDKYKNYKQIRLGLSYDPIDIHVKLESKPKSYSIFSIFSYDLDKLRNKNRSTIIDKLFDKQIDILGRTKINRYHLNEKDGKIIDKIMYDRSLRFRHTMSVMCTITILGSIVNKKAFGQRGTMGYIIMGFFGGYLTFPDIYRNNYYGLKDRERHFKELIDEKYKSLYDIKDQDYFYFIDLFGNIVYSYHKPYTFRRIFLFLD